jgi:type VI secretion system protein ImpF
MAELRRHFHSASLLYVFRAAHEAKDAKKVLDLRTLQGERIIAGRRLSPRRVVSEAVVRREVARDLTALLNTIALESTEDLSQVPDVRKSILNYGIPDVGHRTIDETGVDHVAEEIKAAIMHFEPRLAPESLIVARDHSVSTVELQVRFNVRADLVAEPINIPVEFVADVIEAGKIVVNRL